MCRVKHDPEAGTYGDCVRACIASLLEMDAEKVPHFYNDNCDGETGNERIRHFLAPRYAPFWINYPGSLSLNDIQYTMSILNKGVSYILYCSSGGGDHGVVCRDDMIIHNPAWLNSVIDGPASHGFWTVLVITVV
jgi:hypothetical protein